MNDMHMADALVSPPVAVAAGVSAAILLAISANKIKKNQTDHIVPLMGVMGAFIFAAQMINFSIPGTGSSGHIVGGVLLACVLGPWAAFLTLTSVLIVQCLMFADGGLMALGCNILNMGAMTCLVAWPLLYKPLMKRCASFSRILWVSILTCVVGLELGAVAVTIETVASGITVLPLAKFLWFMLPIHLAIGIGEGLATAAVIYVVQQYKPELLIQTKRHSPVRKRRSYAKVALIVALVAFIIGWFSWVASSDPDGLEWSIAKITGHTEIATQHPAVVYQTAEQIQQSTALMPDYNTTYSGVVGAALVILITAGVSGLLRYKRRRIDEDE
ncbi:MAG: energy-coupling factor ABC transporter permease [Bacteroides sp.]